MSNYSRKVICPDCGIEYSYSNVTAHRRTKKHLSGRPLTVERLGEVKQEFKIPVAPVFNIVRPVPYRADGKDQKIIRIKTTNVLKPTININKSDDLKTVNSKINTLKSITSKDFRGIENGILRRYKYLILKFVLSNGDERYITLTRDSETKVAKYKLILTGRFDDFKNSEHREGSDQWDIDQNLRLISAEIIVGENDRKENKNGGYFPYHNLTNIDLSRYQVYKSTDKSVYEMCLIHALKLCDIKTVDIKKVIAHISKVEKSATGVIFKPVSHFPITKFGEISKIINKTVNVEFMKSDSSQKYHTSNKTYGDFKECINLGLFKNHIFVNEDLPYTKYSITNYNILKDKPNWNRTYDSGRHFKDIQLSVCTILSLMFNANLLKEITDINVNNLQSVHEITNENLLNTIETDQREFKLRLDSDDMRDFINDPEERKRYIKCIEETDAVHKDAGYIFYADLENINSTTKNIPFMAGVMSETDMGPKICFGLDCINQMFDYILSKSTTSGPVVYFHNLKYDFSLMKNFIKVIKVCEKDNAIYSAQIIYKKVKILLKDSYKLFSESLVKFGSAFKLDVCKEEGIGYDFYTLANINEQKHLISDYIKFVKSHEQKAFLKNIERKFNNDGTYFNAIEFYKHYLRLDTLVLKNAMVKYDTLMCKLFGRSIHKHLTISSYADNYFIRNGCYKGVYECKGNLRMYLSKAIYGGRVNVLEKVRKTCVQGPINDFDGVSLYPSAIKRLCDESGLPKGPCQRWNSLINLHDVSVNTYVVSVCITKINKKQNFPFIAYRHDNKIDYVNELTGPLVVVIDKITLEDYIKFHDIEYTILDGVYWNSGFNKTFGKHILYMFTERLKQKDLNTDEGEVLQGIFKLMMNSAYGKTILSTSDNTKIIKDDTLFLKYMFNNYETVEYAQKLNDKQFLITQHKTDESYNRAIVGINILSMSKRIMNEVMGLASDLKIDIFYQDTDSMHMLDKDIAPLGDEFKKVYNRELIGDRKMGQFHSDFSLKVKGVKCKNVIALRSYFLGKKCYMDVLEGKLDGVIHNGFHKRMKGVSENGFDMCALKNGGCEEVYTSLCKGDRIEFILNGADSVRFKFTSDGVHKLEVGSFKRVVGF